ncbi:MAG: aminopeptidase [Firmicutes bacterium]|nr:aminopeptidase [Bacillota bacterium]
MAKKSLWLTYSPEAIQKMNEFCEGYKAFMSTCKTERECTDAFIEMAEKAGYRNLYALIKEGAKLVPGDKVYANNREKMLMLVQLGKEPLAEGLRILGAHIDSPRLDLKPHPLYEDSEFAMFKTHYYGGIKKFQWVTLPLALHGVVALKDGSVKKVVIGEDPSDPVLGISDILPHLGKDQMSKPIGEAFTGEDLNVNIGNAAMPDGEDEKELVKKNILRILKDKYGMEEDDFESAEIEVVPAGAARDFGLDRSMVFAYGHDDRICAYTSVMAQLDLADTVPEKTYVTLLVDKEEIGSVGATGMHSKFFENEMAEIMELAGGYSELALRRMLKNSAMLSSDVSAGFDPNYAGVHEKNNAPLFSYGPVLHKYTGSRGKGGSNDATAEYIAQLRRIFDDAEVRFQLGELGKVDQGGGGTIAYILAQYSMDVIDLGIPLHNMHAPWEVAAKPDIFEAYRAYKVFLEKL